MHTKNIQHIIEHGTTAQMEELRALVVQMVEDSPNYIEYEYCIHKIAHGNHLGEDVAKAWVACLDNGDNTNGQHWTYEQTTQTLKDKGFKFNCWDWYAALNMVYSDYYNPKFDTTAYVELARQWLDDKDAPKDKIVKYYYFVVKHNK